MSVTMSDEEIQRKMLQHQNDAMDLLAKAMRKSKPDASDRHFTVEPAHMCEQAGDDPPLAVQQIRRHWRH